MSRQTTIIAQGAGGTITIPADFRERLGIADEHLLRLTIDDGSLRIEPIQAAPEPKGSPWLRELYEEFAPVRQEASEKGYTDDQINTWIDEAITEVRAERAARRGKP